MKLCNDIIGNSDIEVKWLRHAQLFIVPYPRLESGNGRGKYIPKWGMTCIPSMYTNIAIITSNVMASNHIWNDQTNNWLPIISRRGYWYWLQTVISIKNGN